jgi:hypothetical protein
VIVKDGWNQYKFIFYFIFVDSLCVAVQRSRNNKWPLLQQPKTFRVQKEEKSSDTSNISATERPQCPKIWKKGSPSGTTPTTSVSPLESKKT